MKTIHDIIPDPDVLLKLDLKDLAYVVLEFLNSLDESTQSQILHTHNFSVDPRPVEGYPRAREKEIKLELMEGWAWLERNGLIGPRPNSYGGDWKVITRECRKICEGLGVQSYSHVNLLPKNMLHPVILQAVESDFNIEFTKWLFKWLSVAWLVATAFFIIFAALVLRFK